MPASGALGGGLQVRQEKMLWRRGPRGRVQVSNCWMKKQRISQLRVEFFCAVPLSADVVEMVVGVMAVNLRMEEPRARQLRAGVVR